MENIKILTLVILVAGVLEAGCASHRGAVATQEELATKALGRLKSIKAAMDIVLLRRIVTFSVPGIHNTADASAKSPSSMLEMLGRGGNPDVALSLRMLIEDAVAGKAIAQTYLADCREEESSLSKAKPWSPNADQLRIAKALDATVMLVKVPCAIGGQRLNTSSARSDTNSKAIHSELAQREYDARQQPYRILNDDMQRFIVAQSFRYASTQDTGIKIPMYLRQRLDLQIKVIINAFAPLASAPTQNHVVFDRDETLAKRSLRESPQGYFNAISEDGVTYISPTLARAVFVGCARKTAGIANLVDQLKSEIDVKQKQYIALDAVLIRAANARADQVDDCVDLEARFLLAHELSHSMLDLRKEEQADCMAVAYTASTGATSLGVFDRAIVQVARGPYSDRLGVDAIGTRKIQCRGKRISFPLQGASVSLATVFASCKASAIECED